MIEPAELQSWLLFEDRDLIAIDKPAHVLCHPSKFGPWSSLAGACREHFHLKKIHLPSRLDRETSGIVVVAKNERAGSLVQQAMANREIHKTYYALLYGILPDPLTVDQPIGPDPTATVIARRAVVPDGQQAVTIFEPLTHGDDITLVRVLPQTGRRHQIRVHARHIGHPVIGDKLYAASDQLFLDFIAHTWTPEMEQVLWLTRQALHCGDWRYSNYHFQAPLPQDWNALAHRINLRNV